MKPTKISHFWHWFERHQETFLSFEQLTRVERQYWRAELEGHLSAYNRFLKPVFYYTCDTSRKYGRLVITAEGRSSSFKVVDRLIRNAPELVSWQFEALLPPGLPDEEMTLELQELGSTLGKLWFDLRQVEIAGKEIFYVIAADMANYRYHHEELLDMFVYRTLGERTYGMRVDHVRLMDYEDLLPEDRIHLAPLALLGSFTDAMAVSDIVVRKDGRLGKRW